MFFLIGTSHKVASIDVRERLFLSPAEQDLLLARLRHDVRVMGCFVLSTCNRTEVYAHTLDGQDVVEDVRRLLMDVKELHGPLQSGDIFYRMSEREAVRHIFKVCCGLDSLILGEKQILGQVKTAFERARAGGCLDPFLNRLSQKVLQTGKAARNETEIGLGGASIGWAGVKLAEQTLGTIRGRDILIMGAGKMGGLTAGHLQRRSPGRIWVMNRTEDHARPLVEKTGGTYVPYYQLAHILAQVDVCLCAVGAPHLLVTEDMVRQAAAVRRRPLVLMDISMPRNIDPQIKRLPGVELFCIDDLSALVNDNLNRRRNAVSRVERLIARKQSAFDRSFDRQNLCDQVCDATCFQDPS